MAFKLSMVHCNPHAAHCKPHAYWQMQASKCRCSPVALHQKPCPAPHILHWLSCTVLYCPTDMYCCVLMCCTVVLLLLVLLCTVPQGYKVEWCGKSRPLGDGLKQLWLRVYAPGGLQWTDLVSFGPHKNISTYLGM